MELVTELTMSLDGLNIHLQEKLNVYRTEMVLSFILKEEGRGVSGNSGHSHERMRYNF